MMPAGQLPFKWSNDLNGFGEVIISQYRQSLDIRQKLLGKNDSFIEKSRPVEYQNASSLAR